MSVKCNRKLYKKPINIIIDVLIFDICNHRNMINISPLPFSKNGQTATKTSKNSTLFRLFLKSVATIVSFPYSSPL